MNEGVVNLSEDMDLLNLVSDASNSEYARGHPPSHHLHLGFPHVSRVIDPDAKVLTGLRFLRQYCSLLMEDPN